MNQAEFYLEDLKTKFLKIKPEEYYLSYSGGRDSHLLYWFIKDYLKEEKIEIVGINTGLEFIEIRERMTKYSDRILHQTKKYGEIKEKYGIPCFSKQQDQLIWKYRQFISKNEKRKRKFDTPISYRIKVEHEKGSRIPGAISKFAHEVLFSGRLHKISNLCCHFNKKEPAQKYQSESGKKQILGIMREESFSRRGITTCFAKNGNFYPILDLTGILQREIENQFSIEVPEIYKHVSQTGCICCPYGLLRGETEKEYSMISDSQRRFVDDYFRESYEIRGFSKNQLYLGI